MHTELHKLILDQVKPYLIVHLTKVYGNILDYSDAKLLQIMFTNFRSTKTSTHGLRLSYAGNVIMGRTYDHWTYDHVGNINHKAILTLDKNMVWPYYIGKKLVTFYSENDAAWFRLNGGDIAKYSEYI
jgi:hypothetical protein|tara:strand:- start:556 stop:939 length:384 start_codon:yes stop_codon:yes gene_type:complete